MSSHHVKPTTRGSAAMTLVGLMGEEMAYPREPYRAGCRGHWAAIHPLRVRLEVATPSPTWSLRSSRATLARSCHMGDPNRSNWTRRRWLSRKASPPPWKFSLQMEGAALAGERRECLTQRGSHPPDGAGVQGPGPCRPSSPAAGPGMS